MRVIQETLLLVISVSVTLATNSKTLQQLESEKDELLAKINYAFVDSEKTLMRSNDTDARTGLEHLQQLKKHFNETVLENEFNDALRNLSARRNHPRYLQRGKIKIDLFDIAGLFGQKKSSVNQVERDKTQEAMRQKLREWMAERERERLKIKMYRDRLRLSRERCPKMGLGKTKKKKKSKSRRTMSSRDIRLEIEKRREEREAQERELDREERRLRRMERKLRRKTRYPCCRKCCKSSYLGCL